MGQLREKRNLQTTIKGLW